MIGTHQRKQIFSDWVIRHRSIARKLSRAFAKEKGSAQDLEQDMWIQIWRSIPKYEGACSESTWIYRVCLNTANTWNRGEVRRGKRWVPESEQVESAASTSEGPRDLYEQNDLKAQVLKTIRSLPNADRTLLVLSLDGLSYREISEIAGMTENHVGVALNRARTRLMNAMKEVIDEL